MATTFKLRSLVQNSYAASATKSEVRHGIIDTTISETDYASAAVEATGTDSENGFTHNAGVLRNISGFNQLNPITGGTITVNKFIGFALYVGRASAAVAPTGNPALSITSFAGITTDSNVSLSEGYYTMHHNPGAAAITSGENINVDLTGTTGYKISLVVWMTEA